MHDTIAISMMAEKIKGLEAEVRRWELGWESARQRVQECVAALDQHPDLVSDDCYDPVVRRLKWVLDEVLVVHRPQVRESDEEA